VLTASSVCKWSPRLPQPFVTMLSCPTTLSCVSHLVCGTVAVARSLLESLTKQLDPAGPSNSNMPWSHVQYCPSN
jgi:hypothetical protein